mmetsp:Transcript_78968/g.156424  ORF Transcript_78968/g.156424 Transcript_78968/m.156424 type:complete len:239 (+) Transcript_78968:525-1241(+)
MLTLQLSVLHWFLVRSVLQGRPWFSHILCRAADRQLTRCRGMIAPGTWGLHHVDCQTHFGSCKADFALSCILTRASPFRPLTAFAPSRLCQPFSLRPPQPAVLVALVQLSLAVRHCQHLLLQPSTLGLQLDPQTCRQELWLPVPHCLRHHPPVLVGQLWPLMQQVRLHGQRQLVKQQPSTHRQNRREPFDRLALGVVVVEQVWHPVPQATAVLWQNHHQEPCLHSRRQTKASPPQLPP